jgi:hypothetical protein
LFSFRRYNLVKHVRKLHPDLIGNAEHDPDQSASSSVAMDIAEANDDDDDENENALLENGAGSRFPCAFCDHVANRRCGSCG